MRNVNCARWSALDRSAFGTPRASLTPKQMLQLQSITRHSSSPRSCLTATANRIA